MIWVRTHIRCVTCVCARSGSRCIHTGRRRQRLTEDVSEAWCWRNFSSANGGVSQSDRLMQIPNPVHATPEKYVIGCCNYDGASAPRFRHALRQALTPTPRVNAAWKRYKYCSFSHTNRSFRVLGHQCVVTMGNCLIWISLCMFFFPLIETVTYTCHYMTDRLVRFDLKTSKLDLLKKKKTPTSWMPLG